MKIRNGFVSNSSSSSFILKKLPEGVETLEQIITFYGMDKGRDVLKYTDGSYDTETEQLCQCIKYANDRINETGENPYWEWILDDYFRKGSLEDFYHYYGHCLGGGYGKETIEDIRKHPEGYFEIGIDDDYLGGPGCARMGSYITKNGIEINCH